MHRQLHFSKTSKFIVILFTGLLLNCGGGKPSGVISQDVSGTIFGSASCFTPPKHSQLSLYWQVPDQMGDSFYKNAETLVEGDKWNLHVEEPPTEAKTTLNIAFGYLLLHDDDFTLPKDGMLTSTEWFTTSGYSIGRATNFVIAYKDPAYEINPYREWVDAFPTGLSCGVVEQNGGQLIQYKPTDCNEIEVDIPGDFFPKWR